jgi:N-hydroxyarylamine O-acetyltransferase
MMASSGDGSDATSVSSATVPLSEPGKYLQRIGLAAFTTFAEVHRAHATSIAFENFDSLRGRPVALDDAALEDKLVRRGRGGYCFEHNLLLKAAFETFGIAEVDLLLARVRTGSERSTGDPGPLNHLLLRVVVDGVAYLADVGFGSDSPLEPMPFVTDAEVEQSGWHYRLVADGHELVLQALRDDAWGDLYGFRPEPVPMVDVEVANWFTATHPSSPFVSGLIVGARRPEGNLTLMAGDEALVFERRVGEHVTIAQVDLASVPEVLAERFGIPGVHRGADGRLELPT